MVSVMHPENEGRAAFHAGVKWWENPYPAGSCHAYQWDRGHTAERTKGTRAAAEWYNADTGSDQGLVICEQSGNNIAVCYDKEHAPLIAAAPKMLAALEFIAGIPDATAAIARADREKWQDIQAIISEFNRA